jgi:aerobic-type carbon monoxide dehydrogenase small subunit (CoxS/CutS family)
MPESLQETQSFTFFVNGKKHTVNVPPDMPLLWVLRDIVNLTGTKYSCGMGLCGACTVHMDGRAIRSCITPIQSVNQNQITTIEGLSEHGDHPLQKLWDELNVSQCGYCQAGQIMNAAAYIRDKTSVTDADIDGFQSGNICRCAAYTRIKTAIKDAVQYAQPKEV